MHVSGWVWIRLDRRPLVSWVDNAESSEQKSRRVWAALVAFPRSEEDTGGRGLGQAWLCPSLQSISKFYATSAGLAFPPSAGGRSSTPPRVAVRALCSRHAECFLCTGCWWDRRREGLCSPAQSRVCRCTCQLALRQLSAVPRSPESPTSALMAVLQCLATGRKCGGGPAQGSAPHQALSPDQPPPGLNRIL